MPEPMSTSIDTNPSFVPPQVEPPAPQVAAPPVSAAVTPPPPAAPAALNLDPNQSVQFTDPMTGQVRTVTGAQLAQAHNEVQQMRASGFDLYQRGVNGDRAAARQYLDLLDQRNRVTQPVAPIQPQTPAQQREDEVHVTKAEWEETRAFVKSEQANRVQGAVQSLLGQPEFASLAIKPNAVRFVVDELIAMHNKGTQLNPVIINQTLARLNNDEKAYQERIAAPYVSRIGEMGIEEPFRGGDTDVIQLERPHPIKEPEKYAKYVSTGFRHALRQARGPQLAGA